MKTTGSLYSLQTLDLYLGRVLLGKAALREKTTLLKGFLRETVPRVKKCNTPPLPIVVGESEAVKGIEADWTLASENGEFLLPPARRKRVWALLAFVQRFRRV